MAQNIGNITTSQTFENWFTKTNDLVTALATNVMTASTASPETTNGDAILTGSFTATNLVASTLLSTDTIGAVSGGGTIAFQSPVTITGTSATTATFLYAGTGGQTRYTDGSLSWDIGLENSNPGNFIINTGVAPNKFSLSPAGTLSVPNMVIAENLTVGTLTIGAGGGGLSTDDISEGTTNLYHTDARTVAALSGGDGINLSAAGVISFDGQGELDTYTGNKFIAVGSYRDTNNYAYMDGAGASGSGTPYLRIGIVESGTYSTKVEFAANLNVSSDLYLFGNLYAYTGTTKTFDYKTSSGILELKTPAGVKKVEINGATGNAIFAGDITSNGGFSDRRLKENIVPLDKGLETLEQIKTYTFNYKNRPQDTLPGVIAQEIEEICPEVVYDIEMEDDTYKAVRYQQLVPLLINAVKELSEKVNVLENKLNNESN
tara:strand:+ start:728 stop:2026 length:1299 start_codon:yes stop_codon:yes gene_type:complete